MLFNKNYLLLILFFLVGLHLVKVEAKENSDSFLITISNDSIKVVSPHEFRPGMSVIIDNQTLTKFVGKIEVVKYSSVHEKDQNKKNKSIHQALHAEKIYDQVRIKYVTLNPQTNTGHHLTFNQDESLIFTSLSPPLQELPLKIGQNVYELPARK